MLLHPADPRCGPRRRPAGSCVLTVLSSELKAEASTRRRERVLKINADLRDRRAFSPHRGGRGPAPRRGAGRGATRTRTSADRLTCAQMSPTLDGVAVTRPGARAPDTSCGWLLEANRTHPASKRTSKQRARPAGFTRSFAS
mgnify:CR=1 FL=1